MVFLGPAPVLRRFLFALLTLTLTVSQLSACTPASSNSDRDLPPTSVSDAIEHPLTPEETQELMGKVGDNWLYGGGFGRTALDLGLIYAAPPYAIYLLGNAIASLAGYEPLEVTDALPKEEEEQWDSFYDTVTSGPGRVSAAVAGKDFRTREVIKADYERFIKQRQNKLGTS